jgi:uncharacterized membrane protein YhaH (DUF805 family)
VNLPFAWFAHCLRNYFQLKGRASRPEYWWFYAINVAVSLLFKFLALLLMRDAKLLAIAWSIGLAIPYVAVTSRRLHDTNHSLWWAGLLLVWTCLILGFGLLLRGRPPSTNPFASLIGLAVLVFWFGLMGRLLFLLCKRGDAGPNRFGDAAPLEPRGMDIRA